jgi:hypothetical protein
LQHFSNLKKEIEIQIFVRPFDVLTAKYHFSALPSFLAIQLTLYLPGTVAHHFWALVLCYHAHLHLMSVVYHHVEYDARQVDRECGIHRIFVHQPRSQQLQ